MARIEQPNTISNNRLFRFDRLKNMKWKDRKTPLNNSFLIRVNHTNPCHPRSNIFKHSLQTRIKLYDPFYAVFIAEHACVRAPRAVVDRTFYLSARS